MRLRHQIRASRAEEPMPSVDWRVKGAQRALALATPNRHGYTGARRTLSRLLAEEIAKAP